MSSTIEITSMVARSTHEPFVMLRWGEQRGQLTPTEARAHARRMLEAAEAADQDAFLVSFIGNELGDPKYALVFLGQFRDWRARRDPRRDPEIAAAPEDVGGG